MILSHEMEEVLEAAYLDGIFSKSNLARSHVNAINEALQRAWLTTQLDGLTYGNVLKITTRGLMTLQHAKEQKRNGDQVL